MGGSNLHSIENYVLELRKFGNNLSLRHLLIQKKGAKK
jgi:hypothetical protein